MAFATSQNIDQLLTRGLAFRLPNNAPISSLYTLYANGAGMTYWSNSMNPRDLSTVSTAYGVAVAQLSNTVAFQQGEINDLYGQVSTLSTSISSLSNWTFNYVNSTVAGLSTFSTFYNDLYSFSNATGGTLSTLSASIFRTNSTTTAFFISSLTSTSTRLQSSIGSLFGGQASTTSSVVALNTALLSTSGTLQRTLFSTSAGLTNYINVTSSSVSTFTNRALISTFSTTNNLYSTIQGYAPRLSSLEGLSTNQSTIVGPWISTQLGVSQSTQNFQLISSLRNLSTLISTVAVNAVGQANQLSSFSTVLYGSISTNAAINASQDAAISSLSRNLSILTTSSILAGVYDTFIQLEEYTVNLINSTVYSMNYWQSSLYASTIIQTQAIGGAYFSTFVATAYYSTVSAVTVTTNAFASTYATQLYSTNLATANSLTSTSVGVLYSTSYTNIVNLNSTQISLLYSTGTAFVLSSLGGATPAALRSTVIFIGSNAGSTLQKAFGVAIGFNAGQSNQGCNAIAIGHDAGLSGQSSFAIAIGPFAGSYGQNSNAISIGEGAGEIGQGQYAIGVGYYAGGSAQGSNAIGIGYSAGGGAQGAHGVAVGYEAGNTDQGPYGVAIGYRAGRQNQSTNSIAIGQDAGLLDQGQYAIAIGYQAATTSQTSNTIVLNASGTALETGSSAGFFVAPVRNDETVTAGFVHYDPTSKELVYNSVGGGGGGGGTSTYNILFSDEMITSTLRGSVAITGVNAYSQETARIVDVYRPVIGTDPQLVMSPNLGTFFDFNYIAMSADGKYIRIGNGNSDIVNGNEYTYLSSNYGYDFIEDPVLTPTSNWINPCMNRSGQYQYVINGGNRFSGPEFGRIWRSTDFGATFSPVGPTGIFLGPMACSGDGRYVITPQIGNAGVFVSGPLYKSDDFGATWTAVGPNSSWGEVAVSITGQYMSACAGDAINPATVGVYYSHDYGKTWNQCSGITTYTTPVTMSACGKYQYTFTDMRVPWYSSDYGVSFTQGTPLFAVNNDISFSLSCDDSGQYVAVAIYSDPSFADRGIYLSRDYGHTYSRIFIEDYLYGCEMSADAQFLFFVKQRSGQVYRMVLPTYFPAGTLALNNSPSTCTAYFINSNAGTVPTGNAFTWNSVIGIGSVSNANGSNRCWEIGIETVDSLNRSLGFFSYDTTNFSGPRTINGYIDPAFTNIQMNFTGQHRSFPADDSLYPLTSNIGKVVIATGLYQSMPLSGQLVRGISSITIAESLPLISLASRAKDKRCFGIVCDVEEFNERTSGNGNFVTPYLKTPGDTRIFVNSIGEGAVWVCDINGPVENGDYLTTSDVPGYAMKQGEEYIANYTVAKATMSCDFEPHMLPAQIPLTSTINGQTTYVLDQYSTVMWTVGSNLEPLYQLRYLDMYGQTITKDMYEATLLNGGTAYRAAFLGCTYHCG